MFINNQHLQATATITNKKNILHLETFIVDSTILQID